jgi:hypothetical protein
MQEPPASKPSALQPDREDYVLPAAFMHVGIGNRHPVETFVVASKSGDPSSFLESDIDTKMLSEVLIGLFVLLRHVVSDAEETRLIISSVTHYLHYSLCADIDLNSVDEPPPAASNNARRKAHREMRSRAPHERAIEAEVARNPLVRLGVFSMSILVRSLLDQHNPLHARAECNRALVVACPGFSVALSLRISASEIFQRSRIEDCVWRQMVHMQSYGILALLIANAGSDGDDFLYRSRRPPASPAGAATTPAHAWMSPMAFARQMRGVPSKPGARLASESLGPVECMSRCSLYMCQRYGRVLRCARCERPYCSDDCGRRAWDASWHRCRKDAQRLSRQDRRDLRAVAAWLVSTAFAGHFGKGAFLFEACERGRWRIGWGGILVMRGEERTPTALRLGEGLSGAVSEWLALSTLHFAALVTHASGWSTLVIVACNEVLAVGSLPVACETSAFGGCGADAGHKVMVASAHALARLPPEGAEALPERMLLGLEWEVGCFVDHPTLHRIQRRLADGNAFAPVNVRSKHS